MNDSFQFNGGQTTARKLRREITAYSEGALQTALESGCQSVPDVMAFLARREAAMRERCAAGSRKASLATKGMHRYARRQA